ncbi:hypothetical protein N0V94_001377 [Neodidymelliopsis sp. IMI 364377]|nr:hypothetical protein N0V94_001377 [Neodidymelliopsis sp. IMI 364377]
MTPRTRTSNQDTNFKVYYSKKVPQQVYFPHKRKTVRRRNSEEDNAVDTRQMKFLPERMRRQNTDASSGFKEDEDISKEGLPVHKAVDEETPKSTPVDRLKGRKRKSDGAHEKPKTEEETVVAVSKRRRRDAKSKPQSPTEPHEEPGDTESATRAYRTLRRQSTMTQLADGRRPSLGENEPEFKPIKRRSRVSWGGTSTDRERDRKQRTLTQMIPNMSSLSKEELEELSDLDSDGGNDQMNNVTQSFEEQGFSEVHAASGGIPAQLTGDAEADSSRSKIQEGHDPPVSQQDQLSAVSNSVERLVESDGEEDYQPTQFIDAPSRKMRQLPRRAATRQLLYEPAMPGKAPRSRFSLLSTPEKRRVFEIPSSQSPTESVLSTQVSPQKSHKLVLQERDNLVNFVAETPSKRRQVTFEEHRIQPTPPTRLRKFESTIQDSEDEEGNNIEEEETIDRPMQGQAVGANTQAVLHRIDQVCDGDTGNLPSDGRDSPEELAEPESRKPAYESSPDLGESWAPMIYDDDGPEYESYQSAQLGARSQSIRDVGAASLPNSNSTTTVDHVTNDDTNLPSLADSVHSTPPVVRLRQGEELRSTPMVIRDVSSDDDEPEEELVEDKAARAVTTKRSSPANHHSADLDGQPVQVPRSPSADRETQQSHSSKAEQQLQSEWLSYSQYVHRRAPDSSSMHAAADTCSYNATPRLPKSGILAVSSTRIQHSQATTVDEVTPRKSRARRLSNANMTPHRTSNSQPFVSPEKPPSLFIPSSFPSPSKTAMEGWSSPVMGRTQNPYRSSQILGTLEDFSIPLPPPVEDD